MKFRTLFRPEARAELRKIPRRTAMQILAKLAELENNPTGLSTTALVGMPELRRLRVGDYRVIYSIDHGELIVWVIHVGHRREIYRAD